MLLTRAILLLASGLAPVLALFVPLPLEECSGCTASTSIPGVASNGMISLAVSVELNDGQCFEGQGGACAESECEGTVYRHWNAPAGTEIYWCEKNNKNPMVPFYCEEEPHIAEGGTHDEPGEQVMLECGRSKSWKLKAGGLSATCWATCSACPE